jgi:hypothetical protein
MIIRCSCYGIHVTLVRKRERGAREFKRDREGRAAAEGKK